MNQAPSQGTGRAAGSSHKNRLINEKSPYLRQHADNPVDWYPWGEEAFEKARREAKPIFLSIGYSACHWCRVMERESFEDPEIAQLLNDTFVCIKVDREERPDIDSVYMAVCQMMTGGGGWPLTILMTPDRQPFVAGTYFPRRSLSGRVGLMELIPHIRDMWLERRDVVLKAASSLLESLRVTRRGMAAGELGNEDLSAAGEGLSERFDEANGGFGDAPKFPSPHNLSFLLRYWDRTREARPLAMVEATLKAMRRGGIYDHLGGGFHRYSTDSGWHLPHFEKMLYDQAMLAIAYVEAFQATGNTFYRETAEDIFRYVLRDMTDLGGGFFAAEDADSEGVEGKFYLWTLHEVKDVLWPDEADFAFRVFGLSEEGNFRDEATGRQTGANVLHLNGSLDEVAVAKGMSGQEATEVLREVSRRLLDARDRRPRPHRDNKVLTDWNGLMIAALAKGAAAFDEPAYAKAAERAAQFVIERLEGRDGRLLHRYCDGEAAIPAHLDDYAFFIWGLIELYEATFNAGYLEEALALNRLLLRHFWDELSGGFYLTSDDAETLIVRPKDADDGAIPSGNGVAMLNLARLGRMTADPALEERAVQVGLAFAGEVRRFPFVHTCLLTAVDFLVGPTSEVVLSGDPETEEMRRMQRTLRAGFFPRTVVLGRPLGEDAKEVDSITGFTKDLSPSEGKPTAYVCRENRCRLPVADTEEMLRLLGAEDSPAGG